VPIRVLLVDDHVLVRDGLAAESLGDQPLQRGRPIDRHDPSHRPAVLGDGDHVTHLDLGEMLAQPIRSARTPTSTVASRCGDILAKLRQYLTSRGR
jgi:hypothetical protein